MLSAIRNFFITLLSALLLLGLVGYMITDFALNAIDPTHQGAASPSDSESESDSTPPDTDSSSNPPIIQASDEGFTVLLIGHDYQPDVFQDYDRSDEENPTAFPLPTRKASADMLVVLRVDQKTNSTFICNIPTNAKISGMGLSKTLGSLYGEYGPAYLADKVTSIIGLQVDYYVSVGISGIVKLIDEIGGITYSVPQDMYYHDPVENFTISLRAGSQHLSGEKVMQLLRFNGYGDDGTSRRNTAVSVLKAVIEKVALDRNYYDNATSVYRTMVKYVETNFTQEDAARKLDLMFSYNQMVVSAQQYPGQTVKEETIVYPETETPAISPEDPDSSDTSSQPDDPENPDNPENPTVPTDPAVTDPAESLPVAEPEIIVTYYYTLDLVNGRALFSAYKYQG